MWNTGRRFHFCPSEIIFDAHQRITSFSPPSNGINRTVARGRNITFVCRIRASQTTVHVEWYRIQQGKTAEVLYFNGRCGLRNHTLPRLSVGQTDCEGGQFKLRIKEIDTSFEADWFCVAFLPKVRYQSQYIGFHVQSLGRDQDVPDSYTPQLIGGVAGGGLLLLLIVAMTMYVLVRYRRTRNTDDVLLVMEDNPMYTSCDEENGVHKSGQECDVYTEIQKQPKTVKEVCGQDGVDGGSMYANPDKRIKSACDDPS